MVKLFKIGNFAHFEKQFTVNILGRNNTKYFNPKPSWNFQTVEYSSLNFQIVE